MENKKSISLYSLIENPDWKKAVIVYSQSNWKTQYSLESRSYVIVNNKELNKFLAKGKISNSLWGSSLDGTDLNVRLDRQEWKIEDCYILE